MIRHDMRRGAAIFADAEAGHIHIRAYAYFDDAVDSRRRRFHARKRPTSEAIARAASTAAHDLFRHIALPLRYFASAKMRRGAILRCAAHFLRCLRNSHDKARHYLLRSADIIRYAQRPPPLRALYLKATHIESAANTYNISFSILTFMVFHIAEGLISRECHSLRSCRC